MPYGAGKAVVLGAAAYSTNTGTRDLPVLLWRIVDYLKGIHYATDGLQLQLSTEMRYVLASEGLALRAVVQSGFASDVVNGAAGDV